MPTFDLSEMDIACLMLQAIIQRSAASNDKNRRRPETMAEHVDDAFNYARLVMCRRETPNGDRPCESK